MKQRNLKLTTLLALTICCLTVPSVMAAVTLTKVWPQKIRYLNGENAVFQVWVKNTNAQPWSGRMSGVIESGLDQSTPVFDRELMLATGEEKKLEEQWKVNLSEFGHTLHVVVKNTDGTIATEGREIFCVGSWYFNMGRYITFFNLRNLKTVEQAEAAKVANWRKAYMTCAEHFAGPPGAWGTMTPQIEEFYTGQCANPESITSERALIDAAHRNGMAVMQYAVVSIWGPPAEDYSRAHPDWIVYNDRGRPAGFFNMADMDYFRTMTAANHKFMSPSALCGDVANPAAQEAALSDMINALKMLGYDGLRWDGHTFGKSMNVFGKQTLAGDEDEANAKWVVYMKSRLRSALPGATINYNYYPQSNGEGPSLPKTYKAMGPNAYLLWESMRGRYNSPNDPLNVWTNFIEGVRKEINLHARPNGNFQHFGWYGTSSRIHQNHTQAIYYSLGGHWDEFGSPLKYDAFSMRYGAYLWATDLRNVNDPTDLVKVAAPNDRLWWKQFVQERKLSGGRRILITHLLNKPVHERQNGFEKDAPPVQKDIRVALTLPIGEKVVRAFLLSPDADRPDWCTEIKPTLEEGAYSVVVPSVEYWSFVIWEVGK